MIIFENKEAIREYVKLVLIMGVRVNAPEGFIFTEDCLKESRKYAEEKNLKGKRITNIIGLVS